VVLKSIKGSKPEYNAKFLYTTRVNFHTNLTYRIVIKHNNPFAELDLINPLMLEILKTIFTKLVFTPHEEIFYPLRRLTG
jgi:hypothetical protein